MCGRQSEEQISFTHEDRAGLRFIFTLALTSSRRLEMRPCPFSSATGYVDRLRGPLIETFITHK